MVEVEQNRRKTIKLVVVATLLAIAVAGLFLWDVPRNKIEFFVEKSSIERAARAYLQAEMERNLEQVYLRLAPSSTYRKTHNYEEYLRDVGDSPVRIQSYKIVDIYRFRDNDNRVNYPAVDKLVQVEVDVDVSFTDTGKKSTYNYCFTFLKEKGVWYKG